MQTLNIAAEKELNNVLVMSLDIFFNKTNVLGVSV